MSMRNDLICMICDKILNKPITLPCSCTMCQVHVDEFCKKHKKFSIACQSCNKEIYIPENGFEINKIIKNLIEKDVHLNKKEKEIKNCTMKSLNDLEELFNDLKLKETEFELLNFEHFASIKRDIDIRRETLKIKIDTIAEDMVRRIEKCEETFKQKILHNQFKNVKIDFQKEYQNLFEIFRSHNIAIEKIKIYQSEQQTKIKEIQTKLNIYEAMKENLETCAFRSCFNFENDHFGLLDLSTNETTNLVTCSGNDINIFDMKTDVPVKKITGHSSGIWSLQVIENDKLLSGSGNGSIRLWDLKTGTCLNNFAGHLHPVFCFKALSQNNFVSGSWDSTIKLWNKEKVNCLKTLIGHTDWVRCLELLPNGNLVSGSSDSTIKIWNLNSGLCLKTLLNHSKGVLCLKLLDDSKIASGSYDTTIKIWNYETGECIQTINGHNGAIYGLALTLNSSELISCSDDRTIKVWDLNSTNNCILTLYGHTKTVKCIQLRNDGKLFSCSDDKTIKAWDLNTGECFKTIEAHSSVEHFQLY